MQLKLRWWVAGLLFVSTIINYVDRQAFSLLAHEIQKSLHITDVGYAGVVQLFLVSYTLAYLLTGRVTDRLGSRLSMTVFIVWWSIADVLTAFAGSIYSLGMYRFLLGLGEPGNWTVQTKAISEWFPPHERGLAYGIGTAGATAGATVAVPLIAFLWAELGWRAAFVITGSLGLLWVIPWLWLFRISGNPPGVTEQPHTLKNGYLAGRAANPEGETEGQRWKLMLADSNTWRFTLARLLTDPVWYFFLFWFPKYLISEHSMSLVRVGRSAWVVYLAAGRNDHRGLGLRAVHRTRHGGRGCAPENHVNRCLHRTLESAHCVRPGDPTGFGHRLSCGISPTGLAGHAGNADHRCLSAAVCGYRLRDHCHRGRLGGPSLHQRHRAPGDSFLVQARVYPDGVLAPLCAVFYVEGAGFKPAQSDRGKMIIGRESEATRELWANADGGESTDLLRVSRNS